MTDLLKLFDDLDHNARQPCNVGADHPRWAGGVDRVKVYMPGHPRASCNYVLRSILVMEQQIGRFLKSEEVTHHKDGDIRNDDPANLILCSNQSEHLSKYHPDKERTDDGRFT